MPPHVTADVDLRNVKLFVLDSEGWIMLPNVCGDNDRHDSERSPSKSVLESSVRGMDVMSSSCVVGRWCSGDTPPSLASVADAFSPSESEYNSNMSAGHPSGSIRGDHGMYDTAAGSVEVIYEYLTTEVLACGWWQDRRGFHFCATPGGIWRTHRALWVPQHQTCTRLESA
jgi:hypothetical protein